MPDTVSNQEPRPALSAPPPRRRNLRALGVLAVLWLVFAAIAYLGFDPAKPPPITIGEDTCAACGMTIEDVRFVGNRWIARDENGHGGMPLYDDLGCMLDADRENEGGAALRWYVQDFEGSGWIKASSAWYVLDPKNRTPMSSGILAFRKRPESAAMTFQEIAKARHMFMKAKYGGE